MAAVAQPLQLPAAIWDFDGVHSHVGFEVTHMVVSTFRGRFAEFGATLDTSSAKPRLEGWARVASVDVKEENLAAHLQSPEFFDVERHPELRFVADDVVFGDDGEATVRGEITIKGITKPLEAAGRVTYLPQDVTGRERVGLELEATLDRTDFELNWNAPLADGQVALGNDVRLLAAIEFTKAA